ncbi:putative permease [Desulfosporosinus orientis DSM 765]|uniref:Probable membrane transporter protein n=1 Tax=Desulfosporosinus orientis (strain ATCC 19365 / DSM 765 / NCIMB 8382 / VKM B-1628 / Singapore I) TaxID=768706 RepID=G7W608_DESOD|nr:sulfite exporter TauE/SafE family protein [Desulfosporosinus orientis]AET67384.1 putative permease [Desulfosporosinus orientis DSM 765]
MKNLYTSLMYAARAHAQWEIETSRNIIKNRKKLLILFIMALPLLIPAMAHAASTLPSFVGGKAAFGPSFFSPTTFYGSIAVGVIAGLITGCIGAGGGFVITPALMSLGVKGILAVGTDMFHIFAKAIMGTTLHKKMGNVHIGLAVAFLVGSGLGVTGGGMINRALYNFNPVMSDFVISSIYVVLLGFLGIFALSEYLGMKKRSQKDSGDAHGGPEKMTALGAKLQSINLAPMIKFDQHVVPGGRKISGFFVAICGCVTGFLASILGVGGGFVTFPMFVYGLGISTGTTVGTDILQIIFTAGYGSIAQYAIYGYVFYTLAMGMLLGSLFGIQIGAITTKVVPGTQIKAFYALAILAGFVNRLFALPEKLTQMGYLTLSTSAAALITKIGVWLFFGLVSIFAFWIISTFIRNIPRLRAEAAEDYDVNMGKGGVSQ